MIPTLRPGEAIWILRTRRVRAGDVVVLRDPRDHDFLLVKRAVRRDPAGWWVEGEISGEHLPDSHVFGVVPDRLIVGRVLGIPRGGR